MRRGRWVLLSGGFSEPSLFRVPGLGYWRDLSFSLPGDLGDIPVKTDIIPMAIYFAVEAGKMETATFWVVIITALGFSTILWLNWWRKHNL